MSETPEESDFDFEELEGRLGRMPPSALKVDFLEELERDCARTMSQGFGEESSKTRWKRLVPILAAATVMIAGYVYLTIGSSSPEAPTDSIGIAAADPVEPSAPVEASTRFEPVSSQGYLIKTSSGGIIESENGPVREMSLEYGDAYHWRDPSSGTNLRIFTPRQERIVVPLETQ